MMSETYSTPVGPVRGGSTPSVLRGVGAMPRRRRGRRPPGGRRMARDGPLRDAEAEGFIATVVTSTAHPAGRRVDSGMDRGAYGRIAGVTAGRGLRLVQFANQDDDSGL